MKTALALLCGWFLGLFTVALVASRAVVQLVNDPSRIDFLEAKLAG